ncbi:hypothetical protein BOSEA31B_20346 [Hyphomicrobiales bacterium]|nr:hypothetical protein BOSEA31B_20346 [Hyphomicrobiales bacterium]CAH1702278.1 hypothetical protein BOSEA1005_30150 [Hyphomicrobiales bacterium]CAI0346481.1 hypothetical protein BO1005MUT1_510122 [Hyphomicrobiales bacterium]
MKTILETGAGRWHELETEADGFEVQTAGETAIGVFFQRELQDRGANEARASKPVRFFALEQLLSEETAFPVMIAADAHGNTPMFRGFENTLITGYQNRNPFPAFAEEIEALSTEIGIPLTPDHYPYRSQEKEPLERGAAAESVSAAQRLATAIETIRDRLLAEGVESVQAINAGRCACVVSDVAEELGGLGDFYALGMSEMGIEQLMLHSDDEPCGFDRALIAEHWPNIQPPDGMDWDDLDAVATFCNFDAGTHEWIVFDGKHHDAEAPTGVSNLWSLPFFRRCIDDWQASLAPTPV